MFLLKMGKITEWALGALRTIAAVICRFIYELIAWVFDLLFSVSKIRLLNRSICETADGLGYLTTSSGAEITSKEVCVGLGGTWTEAPITLIYQRVTLLLAIIMVFFITFQFIKYLIEPEQIADKEKGVERLGFKLLTVVALLALVPTFFDKAYDLQNSILESQFLSKIILGTEVEDTSYFGRNFSASFLQHFYYFDKAFVSKYDSSKLMKGDIEEKCDGIPCNLLVDRTLARLRQFGTLDMMKYGLSDHKEINSETDIFCIHFDALLCLVTGAFLLYMLIKYTIDVGARVIQLTFLQVIAPIPIISYLSPKKDGTFQKWVKQCTTTYLDLFVRLAIMYFVMLLIESINKAYDANILLSEIDNDNLKFFIYIILILGLITFIGRVPKLIEELFPSMGVASGTFGLKASDGVKRSFNAATGAVTGAAVGLLGGRGAGRLSGMIGGVFRGTTTGASSKDGMFKNMKNVGAKQSAWNAKKIQRHNDGSTFFGRQEQRFHNVTGRKGYAEKSEDEIRNLDEAIETNQRKSERFNKVSAAKSAVEQRANSKLDDKSLNTEYGRRLQERRRNYAGIQKALENGNEEEARQLAHNETEIARERLNNAHNKHIAAMTNPTTTDKERKQAEKEFIKAAAEFNLAEGTERKLKDGTLTTTEAAQISADVREITKNDYITAALDGSKNIDDAAIVNERNKLTDTISRVREIITGDEELMKDNELENFVERADDITSFDDLDTMDKASKRINNTIENDTYNKQQQKEDILKSKHYQRAQADRNAVGGQQGGGKK